VGHGTLESLVWKKFKTFVTIRAWIKAKSMSQPTEPGSMIDRFSTEQWWHYHAVRFFSHSSPESWPIAGARVSYHVRLTSTSSHIHLFTVDDHCDFIVHLSRITFFLNFSKSGNTFDIMWYRPINPVGAFLRFVIHHERAITNAPYPERGLLYATRKGKRT
jgi:hypothetical protein